MTVAELIEQLQKLPPAAEVLVHDGGDPSVGILDDTWCLTGRVDHDGHRFVSEDEEPWCAECGLIESAHDEAPVVVWMELAS